MRRAVWGVLVLIGGMPAGALAQQEREPPAEQSRAPRQVSNEVLQQQIAELWQALQQLQGEVAQLREQAGGRAQAPAVGGSGRTEGAAEGPAQPGSAAQTGDSGQVGTAPAEDTSRMIIIEQSASGQRRASDTATQASKPSRSGPATGGSGMGPRSQAPAARQGDQIFVGTVRSVTNDRLIMVGPSDRVYEFGLGAQTRIIGPEGHASSVQALEEGSLVRAVTREAGVRNEVRSLQIIGPARAP